MRNKKLLDAARAAGIIKNTVKKKPVEPVEKVVHKPKMVVHIDSSQAVGSSQDGSSRHGVYKDKEARKAYRREWMRKRRAEAKKR